MALYSEAELEKIPHFNEILNGKEVEAYVWECYDGDTMKAIVTIPTVPKRSPIHKVKITCRLYGIDTPERRTKDLNEKRMANLARDALCHKILNKTIKITIDGIDKYGRILAKIPEVEEYLLSNNYGYPYKGGSKKKPIYGDDNSYSIAGIKYIMPATPPD